MVSDESLIQDYIETNEYTETAEHIMRLQKAQAVAFIADAWELTLVPCVIFIDRERTPVPYPLIW